MHFRTRIAVAAFSAGIAVAPSYVRAADQVTITLTSSPTPNPEYDPRNVLAVWVEDSTGHFIRTLARFGARRVKYLRAWNAVALDRDQINGDPDVITGATRSGHAPLTLSWDLTDYQGSTVPDGTYTIRMELADTNAGSPADNNVGTFTFAKNGMSSRATDLSSAGFTGVTIDYTHTSDPVDSPDGGVTPGDPPDPGSCPPTADCRDNDGCCLPDCVYDVDNDCDPRTARAPAAGCAAGRSNGAPSSAAVLVAILFAIAVSVVRRRSPEITAPTGTRPGRPPRRR